MAFDAERHRVFAGCRGKAMVVLDTETGKVMTSVPIGEGVDGIGFDPGTGPAYSSNGDGTLTVVQEASPGRFEVAETVITQRGSRTMAIDPKTHNIYLPAASFAPLPPATKEGPKQRPVMIKDSFTVPVGGK